MALPSAFVWLCCVHGVVAAPVVPLCGDEADTRNFDEEFTKMDLSTSIVELEVPTPSLTQQDK